MNNRRSRLTALVLTIALILSAFPLFSLVSGATEIKISNATEYKNAILNATDAGKDLILNITADFELSDSSESDFAGTINGNGHVITVSTGTALFNQIKESAQINDLGVVLADDKPIQTLGAIGDSEQFRGILANAIDGTVQNCFTYGSIYVTADASKKSYVGGFCGSIMEHANISNSFSCVSIEGSDVAYIGGFAGVVRTNVDHSDVAQEDTSTGKILSCYSAGYIKDTTATSSGVNARRYVAGFANADKAVLEQKTISDTYSSCQIVGLSIDAKPSGVNGLYDNQLSIMRENIDNPGQKTKDLMSTTKLSESFVITSTAYPAIKAFSSKVWASQTVQDIVSLSVMAAAFSDVDSSKRYEPSDMFARADYLTLDTYVDRTNYKSTTWSIDSEVCKVYDTVPVTQYNVDVEPSIGTSAGLLRSRFVFSKDTKNAVLSANLNGFTRQWHLNADSQNIYYQQQNDGTPATPFLINNKTELDYVRYYTLNTAAYYTVNQEDIAVTNFDPIESFQGVFNGNQKTLNGIILSDDRNGNIGLFSDTRSGAVIKDLTLKNVVCKSDYQIAGALIGVADNTTVSNVVLCGSSNAVKSLAATGGLIGQAKECTLSNLLVSIEVDGTTVGGLVGQMEGGSLKFSGVTGFVGSTGTKLGGLIGVANSAVSVENCYSTAVTISTAVNSYAGGLIGVVSSASVINNCYSAALTDAVFADPLFGSGTPDGSSSGSVYDNQFYNISSDSAAKTWESLSDSFASNSNWVTDTENYPQLASFYGNDVSTLSAYRIIYQQYWQDANADNMTTGWIPSSFTAPTVVADLNGGFTPSVYTVESEAGHGFEAVSNQSRIVLKTTSDDQLCVRYAAALRYDLIPITYSVTGVDSLSLSPRVYVEVSYKTTDSSVWNVAQMMSECDDSNTRRMYDIPEYSEIRVRVFTSDEYAVSEVLINNGKVSESDDYYSGFTADDSPVSISVVVQKATETNDGWGVRRETY